MNPIRQCDGKERRLAFEEYETACKLASARNNGHVRAYTAPEQVHTRTAVSQTEMIGTKTGVSLHVGRRPLAYPMTSRETLTLAHHALSTRKLKRNGVTETYHRCTVGQFCSLLLASSHFELKFFLRGLHSHVAAGALFLSAAGHFLSLAPTVEAFIPDKPAHLVHRKLAKTSTYPVILRNHRHPTQPKHQVVVLLWVFQ